jgi:hypothetical protein
MDTARRVRMVRSAYSPRIAVRAGAELAPGDSHEIVSFALRSPDAEAVGERLTIYPVLTLVTDRATGLVLTFTLVFTAADEELFAAT